MLKSQKRDDVILEWSLIKMMNISSSTAQCPFLEKNCPKLIFHEKSNRYIYYFNNKDFLILLKSCVTTLDKKKNQEGHCDCLQQLHHFECVVKTKS